MHRGFDQFHAFESLQKVEPVRGDEPGEIFPRCLTGAHGGEDSHFFAESGHGVGVVSPVNEGQAILRPQAVRLETGHDVVLVNAGDSDKEVSFADPLFFHLGDGSRVGIDDRDVGEKIAQFPAALGVLFENPNAAVPAFERLREGKAIFASAENDNVALGVFPRLIPKLQDGVVQLRGFAEEGNEVIGHEDLARGGDNRFFAPGDRPDPDS